jgi:hybrid cluster-associated redox disulfide protein
MMEKITRDMTIMDVVNKYPQSIKVFFEHGLFCIGCNVAYRETVEQGAMAHGLDVSQLMDRLNEAINNPEPAEKK